MRSVRTGAATIIVPGLACVLGAYFILRAFHQWLVPGLGFLQVLAIPTALGGAWMVHWVSVAFVRSGKGTPIPLDPPERFVVHGLYRHVGNPMCVGALLLIPAEVVCFTSLQLVVYMAALWLSLDAFILAVEEPQLKRRFGGSYLAYLREVPWWIPRLPLSPASEHKLQARSKTGGA